MFHSTMKEICLNNYRLDCDLNVCLDGLIFQQRSFSVFTLQYNYNSKVRDSMASSEQAGIVSALSGESPDTESDVTETVPLKKSSSIILRNSWLRRLRKSIVIKSKAANMILFWTFIMYFVYGIALNPDNSFVVTLIQQSLKVSAPKNSRSTFSGSIAYVYVIASGVYAVIAVWLLFYPLAGYLADVRYGRYKVIFCSLKLTWSALMIFIITSVVISAIFWPPNSRHLIPNFLDSYVTVMCLFGFLAFFIASIGFASFAANVIQFGIDQLQDLRTRDSFLFIYWYLLVQHIGVGIGKLVWTAALPTFFISLSFFLIGWILLIFVIPISLCVAKSRWFIRDAGLGNPYKEVAQIVGFAKRHKVPIRRSAFTYWEDDIPTGLDLGKSKYGGPFTTEQVENVKAFFGILYILLSLGPFFTADIAAVSFLPVLRYHMDKWIPRLHLRHSASLYSVAVYTLFTNGGTLYPLFIAILIPIFLKIIHPLFQKYIPSILKRIGMGLCLITVSLVCSLVVDTIGHALPSGQKATSMFDPRLHFEESTQTNNSINFYQGYPSLHLSPYILIVQQFLTAVAYILIYGGVFEFICAQSPHSMKGVLIGIFFAVKGFFHLIGVLGILLPFCFWQTSPRAGLVYFLVNIVISVVSVVFFIVTARRYRYRQRDEFCNIRKYIEDYYEKAVQHNPKFEELDVNFGNDSVKDIQD